MLSRLYSFLVHLYPAHYREEYGCEMERLFRDRLRREGPLRVCYDTLPDIVITAWSEHMDTLKRDLSHAMRGIVKNPGFALVVLTTLALGIGANTAVFSVVKGVVLDPFPYKNPGQLVQVWEKRPKQGRVRNVVSAPDFLDWKKQNGVFEEMAAVTGAAFAVNTHDGAQLIPGARVTSNFFPMLGVSPLLGRGFLPEEETPGKDRVLLLSHGVWQRHFGGDFNIIGRKVTLAGTPFEVIGVLPEINNVIGPDVEIWQPATLNPQGSRGGHFLNVYARLKAGVSVEQARAAMDTVAARLEQQYPDDNTGHGINIFPLQEEVTGKVRPALFMLLGAVTLVLLVACANVANLFIARTAQRQREISIRTALGAGSRRVVRQLLTETMLLSLLGGAAGIVLAHWGIRALVAANPGNLPRLQSIHIDKEVLLFTLSISVATGLLFGVFPAMRAARAGVADVLKQGGRNSTSRGSSRKLLVVAEVALSLVLLIGCGLMLQSFFRLAAIHPGFETANVLTMDIPLMSPRYTQAEAKRAFLHELTASLERLPGVTSVAAVSALPLTGRDSGANFVIQGRPPLRYSQLPNGRLRIVTPSYLEALRISLRAGRWIEQRDNAGAAAVTVINETMARQHWPGENPIGQRIALAGEESVLIEIVGIVSDVKHYALDGETRPEMYFPYAQRPQAAITAVIRTKGEPENLISAARAELMRIDKDQPVAKIRPFEDILSVSLAQPRLYSALLAIFAAVAIILAAVGIYGVMAFAVGQRTQEMGVRIALGAEPASVRRLVLKEGLTLALAGVALGISGALMLTRVLKTLLYSVEATDPATFGGAALLLTTVAAVACYIPASRATRVDPMVALRSE